jgi:peptide/nickel transport system substrate-binding protein
MSFESDRRSVLLGGAAVLATATLPAFEAQAAGRGGTLIQAAGHDPSSIDAHQARGGDSRLHVGPYNSYLIYNDPKGNLIPGLALSWDWSDNETLVLKLRPGVKFHDGTDFDAEAVKFNIERIGGKTQPPIVSIGARVMQYFKSVDAVDPMTVRITMAQPYAALLDDMTAWWFAMMSPTAARTMGAEFAQKPVGAGPFKLKEYRAGSFIQYERFDQFWQKDEQGQQLPYLDRVRTLILPDPSTRAAALRNGDIQLDQFVDTKQAQQLEKASGIKLYTIDGFEMRWLAFNTGKAPLDNIWLRKAINYAIDRNEIIKAIYQGKGSVPNGFFSPASWAYDANLKWFEFDPEKAKDALKQAGKPDGFKFTAALYNEGARQEAELIQAQLRRVGIEMQLDILDLATFTERYRRQALYDAGFTGHPETGQDPASVLAAFHASTGAFADPSHPKVYDEALAKTMVSTNRDERRKALSAVHEMIYERAGECYYLWSNAYRAYRDGVTGYKPQGDGMSGCETIQVKA